MYTKPNYIRNKNEIENAVWGFSKNSLCTRHIVPSLCIVYCGRSNDIKIKAEKKRTGTHMFPYTRHDAKENRYACMTYAEWLLVVVLTKRFFLSLFQTVELILYLYDFFHCFSSLSYIPFILHLLLLPVLLFSFAIFRSPFSIHMPSFAKCFTSPSYNSISLSSPHIYVGSTLFTSLSISS